MTFGLEVDRPGAQVAGRVAKPSRAHGSVESMSGRVYRRKALRFQCPAKAQAAKHMANHKQHKRRADTIVNVSGARTMIRGSLYCRTHSLSKNRPTGPDPL